MTTAEMKNIKLGDHVVYVAADREYNAMALGAPTEGYNSGAKLGSLFLNLIYLNEQAVPVKILAAPLVGSAADDEHVTAIATAAAQHDPGWKEAGKTEGEREKIVAANVEFVKANPRTIGWRPEEISQASSVAPTGPRDMLVEKLISHLVDLGVAVATIDGSLDMSPEGVISGAAQLLRSFTERAADFQLAIKSLNGRIAELQSEVAQLKEEATLAFLHESKAEAQQNQADGLASAADPNAVAKDQKAAELTAADNASGAELLRVNEESHEPANDAPQTEKVVEEETLNSGDISDDSPVEGKPMADEPQSEKEPEAEA